MNIFLSKLSHTIPHETLILYSKIENCFTTLLYDRHRDDLFAILDLPDQTASSIKLAIELVYREHISLVLAQQGLTLNENNPITLYKLMHVLSAFTTLAVTPIAELDLNLSVETEIDEHTFLAKVLAELTPLSITEGLQIIGFISPFLIDALHHDNTLTHVSEQIINRGIKRFKECPFNKNTIMGNILCRTNNFGLSTHAYILAYHDDIIKAIPDDIKYNKPLIAQRLAEEIIILTVASSTEDAVLEATMTTLADNLIDDPNILLRTNALLLKYVTGLQQ